MFAPLIACLIVSVDAFFIGLSLGMQKRCRFAYLAVTNTFLFILCLLGYFLAVQFYEAIPVEPDLIVGLAFIALGLWTIFSYFISKRLKGAERQRTIILLIGMVMSVEAMLITIGLVLIFTPDSTVMIPVAVAMAHFCYSAMAFRLARSNRLQKIPAVLSHIISGFALIAYGFMALFI